jgi:transcription initiation factor TFIIB
MKTENIVKCPECDSRDIGQDISRGETVCADCGLVIAENAIDPRAEWSEFGTEGNANSRVGTPATPLFHDKGLTTAIPWQNKDYYGNGLSGKTRIQFHRLRKWQQRANTSSGNERNLATALVELDRLSGRLNLSRQHREEAATIYRMSVDRGLVRGRSIDSMVAASVYLMNQKLELARSLDNIVDVTRCSRKEVSRAHKIIKAALGVRTAIPSPGIYVSRFCNELELPLIVEERSNEIISRAESLELTGGCSPMGVAAAAIYIASRLENQFRTQREIADVSNVTEVTIRNRYKGLVLHLEIDIE